MIMFIKFKFTGEIVYLPLIICWFQITTRREERRDNFRMYNPRTIRELQAWTDGAMPIHVDSAVSVLIFVNYVF